MQLISLKNDRGLLENGSCCYGSRGVDGMCLGGCDVVFFICLGHFRANIPEIPECTFGSNVTNVYHHDDHDDLDSITYKLPFAFVWPVSEQKVQPFVIRRHVLAIKSSLNINVRLKVV